MCIEEERGRNKIVPFIQYTQCCLNTEAVFEQQKWPLSAVREVLKRLNAACVNYPQPLFSLTLKKKENAVNLCYDLW